jgi:hypothetical protein
MAGFGNNRANNQDRLNQRGYQYIMYHWNDHGDGSRNYENKESEISVTLFIPVLHLLTLPLFVIVGWRSSLWPS